MLKNNPPERIHQWQITGLVNSTTPPIIVYGVEYVIATTEYGRPLLRRDVMVAEARQWLADNPNG